MSLLPVQQAKAYELVIERIKQAIIDGTFPPGSRLPSVKSLSETLGVGQAAVREAVSALRALRLVEVRQGDGTFVTPLDASEIADSIQQLEVSAQRDVHALLELRIWIETGASQYAALRRTERHLEEIRQILNQMERDLGNAELGEEADWRFHYAIAKASQNLYMQTLMDSIAERIQSALLASRLQLYRIPGEDKRLVEQHYAIYEAIKDQDQTRAVSAMQQHLHHVSKQLQGGDGL
ncbi:GntR family transcriptional regulator [Alicyclobacillus acidoterrestris]|uniref:FadR/GntR family transcriptional regulator n=1 Tax=Alicyclobacillus suci TaxID=2816080 RepID=UPI001193F90B|nr:FadR/GntR family transcriptional regulator [Alicyclobacillus suci]GEO26522.1 GntR family transcriptional regulator [Alicyclobacillus acidoterrestris]